MNFYFEAASVLDKLDAKQGSIKGVIAGLPEKNRKRTAALVIETLKCKPALWELPRLAAGCERRCHRLQINRSCSRSSMLPSC